MDDDAVRQVWQEAPPAPPTAQVSAQAQEIAALRAEMDQLRAAQRDAGRPGRSGPPDSSASAAAAAAAG